MLFSNHITLSVNIWDPIMHWNINSSSWIEIDQLMSLALFFAQHVSNASTFIFRSLRPCVGILLWFDVCWRYSVLRLGWCGILMHCLSLHKDKDKDKDNRNKIKHMLHYNCYIYVEITSNVKVGAVCSSTVPLTIYQSSRYKFDNTEKYVLLQWR